MGEVDGSGSPPRDLLRPLTVDLLADDGGDSTSRALRRQLRRLRLLPHRAFRYWQFGAAAALVLASAAQAFAQKEFLFFESSPSGREFVRYHFELAGASAALLPVLGCCTLFVNRRCGGYLPEASAHAVRGGLRSVGLYSAIGRAMQVASCRNTPLLLQASFGHLLVPFASVLVVSHDLESMRLSRSFGGLALPAAAAVVLLSFAQLSALFLASGTESTTEVFFQGVFLLSFVPLSLAALAQQCLLSWCRANPLDALFRALAWELFFLTLFAPVHCLRDLPRWVSSPTARAEAVTSLVNELGRPRQDRRYLISFAVAAAAAQILQLYVVRGSSYRFVALTVLCIPIFTVAGSLLLAASGWSGACADAHHFQFLRSRLFITALFALTTVAAAIFRLDEENKLSSDFVLPVEECEAALRKESSSDSRQPRAGTVICSAVSAPCRRSTPLHLPPPIGAPRTSLPRPTLLNPWSGVVLFEYTDYKRLHDRTAHERTGRRVGMHEVQLHIPLLVQYTVRHLELLKAAEDGLRAAATSAHTAAVCSNVVFVRAEARDEARS